MATVAARGSGTPATTGTTWAAVTNAVDGAAGTNPATYTTMTSTTASAVATIEITGYGFSSSIGSADTLNSVTVSLRHFENNTARFTSIVFQAFDGATSIGTATTCTLATAARNDTAIVAATLAQLRSSTFKIRVTITGAASTQSRVESIDYVDVTADYTPLPPAITQASYRFYADGTESGSTALAAQDTAYTADITAGDVNLLIRVRLQSTNAGAIAATDDWQLQYEKNASGTWVNVGDMLADSFAATLEANSALNATVTVRGQSFLGNGLPLRRAGFVMRNSGAPVDNVTAQIYAHTGTFGAGGVGTGSPLTTSAGVVATSLSTTPTMTYFVFDGTFTPTNGTPYVLAFTHASDVSNWVAVGSNNTGGHAGNPSRLISGVWTADTGDSLFELYTQSSTVPGFNSANLTDGGATTNRLGAGTGSFVAGKVSEDGLVDDLGWTANNFTEVLYSLTLKQAALVNGDTLRFRVLRNGATTGMTYTQTPTVPVATGPAAVALAGTSGGLSTVTGTTVVARALAATTGIGTSTTTGAFIVARTFIGAADGTSTTTAALTVAVAPVVLAGQTDGAGTTTGAVVVARAFAATTTGSSTTTGTLTTAAAATLTGQTDGASTTTANIVVARALTAPTVTGTSTTTGTLTGAIPLAGRSDGAAGGLSATLLEPFNDYTTNSWTTDANWTIVAGRTGTGARGAGASSQARYAISAPNQSAYLTVGFAYRISNATGTRTMFRLESDSGTTSHIFIDVLTNGSVEIWLGGAGGVLLASTAAAVIPINTYVYVELQALLADTGGFVTMRVNGTQVAAATNVDTRNAGTKTVFDTLCLLGPASGINNIFDDLYIDMGPSATFKGDITLPAAGGTAFAATLTVARTFAGNTNGISTTTGAFVIARTLTSSAAGVATTAGNLVVSAAGGMAAFVAGTSTTTAALSVAKPMAATATGIATATGSLATAIPLTATTAGLSNATASLAGARPLAANANGVGTAIAAVVLLRALVANANGIATATGALSTVSGAVARYWNGTTFVAGTVKIWNGTTFTPAVTRTWNGTSFI